MHLPSRISSQIYNPSSVFTSLSSLLDIPAMNAMLDLLRLPGKKGVSTTKFAVLFAQILFAVVVAWFAIPFVFGFLGSAVPRLWTCVRSATAPPYLFLAINFIILAIWKLSENRSFYTDSLPEEESSSNPSLFSLRSRDPGSAHAVQLLKKTSPEDCSKAHSILAGDGHLPDYAGEPESSCLTTESEEKSISSSPPPSHGFPVPEPALAAMDPEREEVAMVDGRNEDDSLNATWNSILRKSGRFPATAAVGKSTNKAPAATPRDSKALPECSDDINQRFDDFIKKNYDQIRLKKAGGPN